ncbi:MAG: 1,2-phenylacetyl-CoA epoxidase subunit PaaC [Sphingobacteriia bacterium]|jgi:ring-1,2-phenylacetyl-CoA epoxidase subunit PaaC
MKMLNKIDYLLHLADNALIIGHRCSEWCGHGPILEQDIAVSNIALDYIGQARNLYQYAAELINSKNDPFVGFVLPSTEDSLAYLRDTTDYKNHLLLELPNGDWAVTTLRLFLFSSYQYFLFNELIKNEDSQLSAIAEKSLKEVTYHVRWSGDWVIRLGDGTDESKNKIEKAIDYLWPYTGELFSGNDQSIELNWNKKVEVLFNEATLKMPTKTWMQEGGLRGIHTEHLGFILAEMQHLQRAYPNSEW